jgi:hypothetical protein
MSMEAVTAYEVQDIVDTVVHDLKRKISTLRDDHGGEISDLRREVADLRREIGVLEQQLFDHKRLG